METRWDMHVIYPNTEYIVYLPYEYGIHDYAVDGKNPAPIDR